MTHVEKKIQDRMYSRGVGPSGGQPGSWPRAWRVRRRLERVAKRLRANSHFDRTAYRIVVALDAICQARSARVSNLDGRFADLWRDLSLRRRVARSRLAFTAWRRAKYVSPDSVALSVNRVVWSGCRAVWATIEYKSVLLKYGSAASAYLCELCD